jgi:hypothetical protein
MSGIPADALRLTAAVLYGFTRGGIYQYANVPSQPKMSDPDDDSEVPHPDELGWADGGGSGFIDEPWGESLDNDD